VNGGELGQRSNDVGKHFCEIGRPPGTLRKKKMAAVEGREKRCQSRKKEGMTTDHIFSGAGEKKSFYSAGRGKGRGNH